MSAPAGEEVPFVAEHAEEPDLAPVDDVQHRAGDLDRDEHQQREPRRRGTGAAGPSAASSIYCERGMTSMACRYDATSGAM